MKAAVLVITLMIAAFTNAADSAGYRLEKISDRIRVPWALDWLPGGDMLVTSRPGKLFRLVQGGQLQEISGLPEIDANGQGGLLDIALHPRYAQTGWIYLSYSSPVGEGRGSNTAIMRAQLQGHKLVNAQVLYRAQPNDTSGRHYGSRIVFDREGYLYFSVGDRGHRDVNPQSLERDGGKIYRLKDNGEVPPDNPFLAKAKARVAVYSLGHRNPQGMALHPDSGEIWIHEHGPRGGDEINIIKAGENYGWPILSYGINYNGSEFAEAQERPGYISPVHYWVPSIAPAGMVFVTSDKYPDLKGHLLVGSLKFARLELVKLKADTVIGTEEMFKGIGRVRDVKQGPDGYLYVATESEGIFRIVP